MSGLLDGAALKPMQENGVANASLNPSNEDMIIIKAGLFSRAVKKIVAEDSPKNIPARPILLRIQMSPSFAENPYYMFQNAFKKHVFPPTFLHIVDTN